MEKQINDAGNEVFSGASFESEFDPSLFHEVFPSFETDKQYALHTNIGSLTVLDRMTGFGWRDVETGYRDTDNKFWLASGGFDVRKSGCKTLGEAIEYVKKNANTCIGDK